MKRSRWLPPEREPGEGGMVAFRRGVLLFLSLGTFQGAWMLVPWATESPGPTAFEAATIALGIALSGLVFLLRNRWPLLASRLYAVAGLPYVALVVVAFDRPVSLALLTLPALAAGLLLGRRSGILFGIGAVGLMVLLNDLVGVSDLAFWVVLLVFTTGLGALAGHFASQVDYWERALVQQQRGYIEQLRDRQGELNRTLKALDEAYESLKRTNEELRLARRQAEEARALKEQFVANVSHELRTPLNLIVGFAEMMYLSPEIYDGVTWTPMLEGDVHEVYRASRHLQGLVNDILDMARIDASRMPMFRELQDLRAIVQEAAKTVEPLFRQRGLTHTISCPDCLPDLFVDPTRIRQVMLNLYNNAARYTDQGGVRTTIVPAEDTIVVGVHDTGVGIGADQQESIFEEFRQPDPSLRGRGGAGLGLALSREFVRLHSGRMWVESTVGRGSSFYFALPLPGTIAMPMGLQRTPDRHRIALETAPVVVVDPDPSTAEMLSRYLDDRPVLSVSDVSELPAVIESEHPLAVILNLSPDLAPEAWFEAPAAAVERHGVPVFRCSIPSPSWLRSSTGFDEILTKPISQASLDRLFEGYAAPPARVLIVDNDPGFVRLVCRMLRDHRTTEIHTAYGGEHALRLAREAQPQLVLLDLLMPDVDGFAVLSALRADATTGNARIVAVTASGYAEEALQRLGRRLTLTQSTGLSPGTLVDLLSASLRFVRPDYVSEDPSATSREST